MKIAGSDSMIPLRQLSELGRAGTDAGVAGSGKNGFESIFRSALDLVHRTNQLTNAAEREEINFALGYTDNISTLMAAQRKADISLQYTVAVRNAVMGAYKEIMNLQF